jgi:hypothetical protein
VSDSDLDPIDGYPVSQKLCEGPENIKSTGVQRKEKVDKLADCAVVEDRQAMDHINIVNNLGETGRRKDF